LTENKAKRRDGCEQWEFFTLRTYPWLGVALVSALCPLRGLVMEMILWIST
jgi:hypothetical protein